MGKSLTKSQIAHAVEQVFDSENYDLDYGKVLTQSKVEDVNNRTSPAFGNKFTVSTERPALISASLHVEGTGTTDGEIALHVDFTGDGLANITMRSRIGLGGLTGSTTIDDAIMTYAPPGSEYWFENVSDPNTVNAVNDSYEFPL